jgi:hypothetical protein
VLVMVLAVGSGSRAGVRVESGMLSNERLDPDQHQNGMDPHYTSMIYRKVVTYVLIS